MDGFGLYQMAFEGNNNIVQGNFIGDRFPPVKSRRAATTAGDLRFGKHDRRSRRRLKAMSSPG